MVNEQPSYNIFSGFGGKTTPKRGKRPHRKRPIRRQQLRQPAVRVGSASIRRIDHHLSRRNPWPEQGVITEKPRKIRAKTEPRTNTDRLSAKTELHEKSLKLRFDGEIPHTKRHLSTKGIVLEKSRTEVLRRCGEIIITGGPTDHPGRGPPPRRP